VHRPAFLFTREHIQSRHSPSHCIIHNTALQQTCSISSLIMTLRHSQSNCIEYSYSMYIINCSGAVQISLRQILQVSLKILEDHWPTQINRENSRFTQTHADTGLMAVFQANLGYLTASLLCGVICAKFCTAGCPSRCQPGESLPGLRSFFIYRLLID